MFDNQVVPILCVFSYAFFKKKFFRYFALPMRMVAGYILE